MKTCRACLTTGDVENMLIMDKIFLQNYNTLTGLNVMFCEDMPLYTCKPCSDGVTYCIDFKNKCIESDLVWKEMAIQKTESLENDTTDYQISINYVDTIIKKECDIDDNFEYSYDELYYESSNDKDEIKPKAMRRSQRCKTKAVLKQNEDETKSVRKNNTCKTKARKENKDEKCSYSCGLCALKFEDKPSVCQHLEEHKNDMECEMCQEHFMNLPHLLSHRFEHIPDKQKFCHICDMKFKTTPGLEIHYMRKHEMAKKNDSIACKKCFLMFNSKKAILAHIASKHSDLYKCEVCDQGFGRNYLLNIHKKKHLPNVKTYKCKLCDYTSKYGGGVSNHVLRRHTKGRVYCKTCHRVYRSKAELDKHECKKLNYLMCPVCGINVNGNSTRLKRHMMAKHDDVPRFECDLCSTKLRSKASLRLHMDKHAGKPRHQCSYCQRKFYFACALLKHTRIHTGEKPYVCKICNKGFTGNHNLKVHMKVHGITNLIKKKEKTEDLKLHQIFQ